MPPTSMMPSLPMSRLRGPCTCAAPVPSRPSTPFCQRIHARPLVSKGTPNTELLGFDGNLAHDPFGGHFVVVKEEHVKPVRAPIKQVGARAFEPLECAYGPFVEQLLGLDKRSAKAALMAEGEQHAAIGAGPRQCLGIPPCAGHGLFAVDGFDASRSRGFDHLAVQAGPRADAHHIEDFAF